MPLLKILATNPTTSPVIPPPTLIIKSDRLKFLDNKNSFTEDDWSEIYNLSLKTYVDESDKSRERTAGAGLTDND